MVLGGSTDVDDHIRVTSAEIARESGIDLAAVSRLEAGKNPNPTFETLSRYAAALGLRLEVSLVELEDLAAVSTGPRRES
jgi:transcriptional regulator with XRE-family HTH domain